MTSLRAISEETTSQVEGKLNAVVMKIEEAEARINLFQKLKCKNMCTKDIFQAAKSQLRSRRVLTKINRQAIKRDMTLKIRDAGIHLLRLREEKVKIRQQLLRSLGGKTFRLREITKKQNAEAKIYRRTLDEAYRRKIEHYMRDQGELTQTNKDGPALTIDGLNGTVAEKYSAVIAGIDEMEPEKPAPPMICSPDIKLSECELALLSKGPKFSIRPELDSEMFEVELESMITKKKYRASEDTDLTVDEVSPTTKEYKNVVEGPTSLDKMW